MLYSSQEFVRFMSSSTYETQLLLKSRFYNCSKVYIGNGQYIADVKPIASDPMRGFKAFNSDWTCRGKQYRVGETFKEDIETPIPCTNGMHFCADLIDIFYHYEFDFSETRVAEVEATGVITTTDAEKFCTNELKIIKEVSPDVILSFVKSKVAEAIMYKFPFEITSKTLSKITEADDRFLSKYWKQQTCPIFDRSILD